MKKIVVIDNYDSFTYNLVHYIKNVTGILPDVFRNDKIRGAALQNARCWVFAWVYRQ